MTQAAENIDASELAQFESLAARWWDTDGEFKPLHDINPLRLNYIDIRLGDQRAGLAGKAVLDVGCGGGILAESMAARGARVTGIDLGEAALAAARSHSAQGGLEIDYRHISAEALAAEQPETFDSVTCMELLEHLPDPAAVVAACATLVRPGGDVFFSTINRNPKSFALAILGAEYLLGMLPRGTHEYAKFIRPAELAGFARHAGLDVKDITGLSYNPLARYGPTRGYRLGRDVDVNYLMHTVKA